MYAAFEKLHVGKSLRELFLQNRDHRVFGIEVVRVDEGEPVLRCLLKLMVFHIGSHIGVAALENGLLETPRAGAAHDGDAGDQKRITTPARARETSSSPFT